jgi:membrane-associated protein
MDIHKLLDVFLHLDHSLNDWAGVLGPWLYVLLFLIIFCETGLVVTPFLPGDSLLFAVGALAAGEGSVLNLPLTLGLLCAAAISGDAVNYAIGMRVGPRVFSSETSWFLNKEHLMRTEHFYERHGGKTIILARFLPIVRTYVPFVAGIGAMPYLRYIGFCVTGAVLWVISVCTAGYFFGNIPMVKNNLSVVIVLIVLVSVSPAVFAWGRARLVRQRDG